MSSKELKQIALDFLGLAAKGEPREAFTKYVSGSFKHHNIHFRGDAESLMRAMEESAKKSPNKKMEIQRVLQDGDLVAIHSRVYQNPDDLGTAVMHIFRFEGDKIIELWDFGQPVPAVTINENGMF